MMSIQYSMTREYNNTKGCNNSTVQYTSSYSTVLLDDGCSILNLFNPFFVLIYLFTDQVFIHSLEVREGRTSHHKDSVVEHYFLLNAVSVGSTSSLTT